MLKDRLVPAALVFVLFAVLSPLPSQAAPGAWTTVSRPAASLFAKVEQWWGLLLNGGRPAQPQRTPDARKQGCAIDPHGSTVCGTGSSTTTTTTPAPSDSGTD
jgi:hypothetical protein